MTLLIIKMKNREKKGQGQGDAPLVHPER